MHIQSMEDCMIQRLFKILFLSAPLFLAPAVGHSTTLPGCFSSSVTYDAVYNYELTPAENEIDSNFAATYISGSGSDQEANCDCSDLGLGVNTQVQELTAVGSPLSAGGAGRAHLTDHLDVSMSGYSDAIFNSTGLTLLPIKNYPTPIDKLETRYDLKSTEKTASVCRTGTAPSGASQTKRKFRWNTVSMHFFITKPIFGSEIIPPTVVAQYYACLFFGQACQMAETQHVSDVILSGVITAPLSCTINAGGVIEVDMGSITTPQFVNKGQPPAGYTLKNVDITYHCDDAGAKNTSDKIKLTLTSDQGVVAGNNLIAKMIGRDDVGVRLYDENSNDVILDGSVEFPVTVDQDGNGRIKMKAAPVSTTDKLPTPGEFEGNMTVKMDIK